MKQILRSLTSFSRAERAGLLVLSSILLILIVVRTTMSLWVHPTTDKEQEAKLVKAWAAYKKLHDPITGKIDLSTADSETLISLAGIGSATAHDILLLRATNRLHKMNDLWLTGHMNDSMYSSLASHAYIDSAVQNY